MKCIRCQAPLKTTVDATAKAQVEACVSCRGFWFKQQDILKALGISDIGKSGPQDRINFKCPQCTGTSLAHFHMEGLNSPIIACPKCMGVWADGGQFSKLKMAVQELVQKRTAAKSAANFNLAMDIPENVPPPKKPIDGLMVVAFVIFGLGLAVIAFVFLKR